MFQRLWNVFCQRRIRKEIRQEMETHLALIEEESLLQGHPPKLRTAPPSSALAIMEPMSNKPAMQT
jgi:hypothetical protein